MENNVQEGGRPAKKKTSGAVKVLTAVAVVLVLLTAVLIGMLTYRLSMENLDLRMPMGPRPAELTVETNTP